MCSHCLSWKSQKNLYLFFFFNIFQAYVIKAKGGRTDSKISTQQLSNKGIYPSCRWVDTNVCSGSTKTGIDLTVPASKNNIFNHSHLSYFNLSLLSTLLSPFFFSDEWPSSVTREVFTRQIYNIMPTTTSSLVLTCHLSLHKQLS